ncbi:MAG: endonuclease MutS2 [Anaerolineaceae bacterium]|nr:MAG: endonuclease MutS2 [Anaerolineaceae bacterium]
MDSKTLSVLEYPKILDRLAANCAFSASVELARQLKPSVNLEEIQRLLAETTEARLLITVSDASVGGAHDVRPAVELARRGGVIDPQDMLDIKSTLISARELRKTFGIGKVEREESAEESKPRSQRRGESPTRPARPNQGDYPHLTEIARGLPDTLGLVDAISRTLSDRGEVLDSASPKLASLRREIKTAHDRLMTRLQKYITDPRSASMLQENIITQRDGRYVIPLRAENKGKIKAIVHDQSSSGATLFIEPLPIVEANNELRELQLKERDEERRVLAELSALVAQFADEIVWGVDTLAQLDLAFAKAKYAEEIRASEPVFSVPPSGTSQLLVISKQSSVANQQKSKSSTEQSKIVNRQSSIRLFQARHPLLDPATVVPIDFDLPENTRAVVITGPNTGGKTVALKTVGLIVLMAQSGLHVPAASGSVVSLFKAVYADIGDEQSIQQSLSTFSGHITNIIRILKKADERALVILDELGAGTDPQEGAALARAILAQLLKRGVTTLVTTHHPELKQFAHETEGVVNASVEFDVKTLRPTFQLTIGLPGRSNAIAIASRLGLDPEIVAAAKSEVHPDDLRTDKLLDDIRKERNRSSRERDKAIKARQKTDTLNAELEKRLEKIEDERREVLAKARAEGELEVAVLKRNINSLKQQLANARQPLDALKSVEKKVEAMEEKVEAAVERRPQTVDGGTSTVHRPPSLGERVRVSTLNAEGVVTALGESDAEVQIGSLRVRARLVDLERNIPGETSEEKNKTKNVKSKESSAVSRPPSAVGAKSPGLEVSLRGMMVEDALEALERYLEKAYLAGLPFVRIVHGKGTGKLRAAVRDALRGHAYVRSFEEAHPNEGGEGVTVALIAN